MIDAYRADRPLNATDYRDYHALYNTACLHIEAIAALADRKAGLAGECQHTRGYRKAATELAQFAHICVTLSRKYVDAN